MSGLEALALVGMAVALIGMLIVGAVTYDDLVRRVEALERAARRGVSREEMMRQAARQ